ncbi:27 kDa glycoprotein-like, partial [Achroia grisella]|uniref:27 kDa glycoprotein-like n=1 Tax=Achroia grisella TaxID=688607 RepID=UPI0027D28A1B
FKMFSKGILFVIMVTGVICDNNIRSKLRDHIHKYTEAECTKNNARDKISEVEEVGLTFMDCMLDNIKLKLIMDMEQVETDSDVTDVYKRLCRDVPQTRTCLYNFLNGTAPCMKEKYRNEIDSSMAQFDELYNYMCANDSQRFTEFVADGGLSCVHENGVPLSECLTTTSMALDGISGDNSSEDIKSVCEELQGLQKCIHDNLVGCPKKSTSAFFDGFLELVQKFSECNDVE